MIQSYLKKRNIAAAAYLLGMAATYVHLHVLHNDNDNWISRCLMVAVVTALAAACWFYLKAKKRDSLWLLLLPSSGIAVLIYWFLNDCSDDAETPACASCGAMNFATDTHCRMCEAPLSAGP